MSTSEYITNGISRLQLQVVNEIINLVMVLHPLLWTFYCKLPLSGILVVILIYSSSTYLEILLICTCLDKNITKASTRKTHVIVSICTGFTDKKKTFTNLRKASFMLFLHKPWQKCIMGRLPKTYHWQLQCMCLVGLCLPSILLSTLHNVSMDTSAFLLLV